MTTNEWRFTAWVCGWLLLVVSASAADDIRAEWRLEAAEAMVGQKLALILEVAGIEAVEPPDISIPGVEVIWEGGSPNSSTSIVTVNGRTTTTISRSFVGRWSLKAVQPGQYRLDARNWKVGGVAIRLRTLTWTVTAARTDERFPLEQRLSRNAAVPGVPIQYTLTWYLGQSARTPEFSLPILDDPNLEPVEGSFAVSAGDVFQTEYRGRLLTGVKGQASRNGQQYTSLTFTFAVKPLKPGRYDLSGTAISFEGAIETRQVRDFFGRIVDEPFYRPLVSQADPLVLEVVELPSRDQPTPFSGLIGKLSLSWSGALGSYKVGEPIRLTLKLDGVLNKPNLDLDYMVTQALADASFTVVPDSVVVAASANERGFVFRAKRSGKMVIPSLKINYFNPDSGRYGEAVTAALQLDILPTAGALATANNSIGPSGSMAAVGLAGGSGGVVSGSAALNPPGLSGGFGPRLPWWLYSLPGVVVGTVLMTMGVYRHSRLRRSRRARRAWLSLLAPLAADDPREKLDEGRGRLRALLATDPEWRRRLETKGKWLAITAAADEWDRAFFAAGREGEPWDRRWNALAAEARNWK